MNAEEIKKLKVTKVKCDNSYMFFIRYHFKKRFNRKFIVSDHHIKIVNMLERVVAGEITRLIINIAPRYGKTEIGVKNIIAYCLSLNAAAKFIHLSYSDDLALDNSEEIKDIILSDHYQQLYPNVKLKKDSKSKKKWYTTEGGGVYATSASGQVTGFGAGKVDDEDINEFLSDIEAKESFGGAIIIDDPIKPDDADSDTARNKINNKFDSTIRNRVNSRNTPIIIIMQRVHPDDLCGYLQEIEGDQWVVLSLPAIYDLDGELKPLWEFKHTLSELNHLKKINPIVFERQYMQNPMPLEGLVFSKEELKTYKALPTEIITENGNDKEVLQGWTFMFADTADEGQDNFSAPIFQIVGDYVYLMDAIFDQQNLTIQESQVISKSKEHKIRKIVVETNAAGAYFKRRLTDLLPAIELFGQYSSANKMSRILSMTGIIKLFFLFPENPNPTTQKFMNQVYKLLKTSKKEDDAPDSLSGAAAHLEAHYNMFK